MRTGVKRWRAAAIAVVGAGALGGWFGLAKPASAEPIKPPRTGPAPANGDAAVWTRVPVIPASGTAVPDSPPAVIPAIPTTDDKAPALPVLPAAPPLPPRPVVPPSVPLVPPPAVVTPPAPPAKSEDPAKPMSPAGPDSTLRPGDSGNSVKPGTPATPTEPKLPAVPPPVGLDPVKLPMPAIPAPPGVPALPGIPDMPPVPVGRPTGMGTGAEPPATTVERPKPPEGPLGTSEKYVFPVPRTPGTTPPVNPLPVAPTGTGPKFDTNATTPGDPTMFNASRQTALAAVIGGALAFAPANPAAALPLPLPGKVGGMADPPKDNRTEAEKIADLLKDVKRLTEMIEGRKDEAGFPIPNTGLKEKVQTLENKIAAMEKQLEAMKGTTALRPGGGGAVAARGIVRVVNEYPIEVSIVVNDSSYRVVPGKTRDVEIPAGDFTYQLLQNGAAPTKSTIKDKEVVTLRIK